MASPDKKLTPVMRQYDDAKSAHPDAILFFRLGDFYEVFYDDAVLVSKALGLTLTSRSKGALDNVPMAGVPFHAADGYVAKLIALGHKVALCEQLADPSKVKGIVPRGVVRVVTPGLVTDGDRLEARENNYLAAIDHDEVAGTYGLALLDLSTAEMLACALPDRAALVAELARAEPREALLAAGLEAVRASARLAGLGATFRDDEPLADADVRACIDQATGRSLYADAAAQHQAVALRAAGRALRFARRCSPTAAVPVQRIAPSDPVGTLHLDETAQSHLELVRAYDGERRGSLLDVIDQTVTPTGARLLRRRLLAPLLQASAIRRRHDEVELLLVHARARAELRQALDGVGDLERLAVRATLGVCTPRDLGGLRDGLLAAPSAARAITSIPDSGVGDVLGGDVDLVPELAERLRAALVDSPPPHGRDGGIIRDGHDPRLDELRAIRRTSTELIAGLESSLRAQTDIGSLRVKYTRVFGWYIEVTRTHLGKVPASFRRKQTVAGGERYTTEALDELAEKIDSAEERSLTREGELFEALVAEVARAAERIRALARRLAEWDVAGSLAEVAHRFDFARPTIDDGPAIVIEEGRHPVVERFSAAGRFVANDTTLDLDAERLWLVTGPNMAGKSTLMRQVALIVILAQMGSYVPARRATIGLVDRVLSRVGASDNVARGESTFMVEMRETASILKNATRRSLVILDEIGRGTSTYDGLAIAWAVTEHLHEAVGCRALFATHYHELTQLGASAPSIANYSVSAREHEGDVVFLHKLVRGPASQSYGVAVARLAGLPESVLARAASLLASLEAGAALPSGKPSTLRGRSRSGQAQLDLFAAPPTPALSAEQSAVLSTLAAVDVDRLTPLDALGLVAKLKALGESG